MVKLSMVCMVALSGLFIGCVGGAPKALEFKPISASFVDKKWDGIKVPLDEVCRKFNTKAGEMPSIRLSNLPVSTKRVELSFNDETFLPMGNGGHGVLEYSVAKSGQSEIVVPIAPGQVSQLPAGFTIKRDFSSRAWDSGSGYLAPCSGGQGNNYTVDIKTYNDKGEITGEAKLNLGRY